MLKEVMETMEKEKKETRSTLFQQLENTNKETEIIF